ncbi:hypothetical protein BH23CHL5_BH23CHL5_26830 [soil metagenome]
MLGYSSRTDKQPLGNLRIGQALYADDVIASSSPSDPASRGITAKSCSPPSRRAERLVTSNESPLD